MAKERYWTESEVVNRLKVIFPSPAYVLLSQVRNGTGWARARTRTADAVAMSVWPSRGLYLIGFEVKVSRSDWRKELADPSKAHAIQQYCRYWYIASPVDVVPAAEVPETWGQIVCRGNTAEITKPAPQLKDIQPDLLLLGSILRATAEASVPAGDVQEQISEHVEKARVTWNRQQSMDHANLQTAVDEFEAASGLKIRERSWRTRELGRVVAFVEGIDLMRAVQHAEHMRDEAATIAKRLGESIDKMKLKDASHKTAEAQEPAE